MNGVLENLNLNSSEFQFQFQSHPNYSSALAFSDTLNFLGVKNDAYELEKEYWEELPEEFITIYKGNFALVHRNGSQAKIFTDKEELVSFDTLKENAKDFVLLFEKKNVEKTVKPNSLLYLVILFSTLAILLINTFLNWKVWSFLFQMLSLSGVYLFYEIFKEKFGSDSVVLQSFCGMGAKQQSSEDACKKIIQSKDFKLFDMKFSDFGFVYFIAISILPLLISKESIVFLGITSLSLFSVIYSVYYQISQKIFCKVCGLVIGILLAQFAIAYFSFREDFSILELLVTLFSFLIVLFLIHYISKTIEEKEKYRKENIKNLRFKRNYELFKRELLDKEKVIFKDPKAGFFFGNENAKIHITLISNPYCGYCKDAHHLIEKIIENHNESISLQIRFNITENEHEEYKNLISLFDATYKNNASDLLKLIRYWYEERKLEKLQKLYPHLQTSSENLKAYYEIGEENAEKQLNFTPIILINGYQFPDKYDRKDINYFIDDILEDEEIINEA